MASRKTQPRKSPNPAKKTPESAPKSPDSANEFTAEHARKILKLDLARIVQKVKAGKPLSAPERNLMSQMAASGGSVAEETPDHVQSVAALAGILGVSRRSIQLWRKRYPDAPKNRTNGDHDVAAWREFVRARGLKEVTQEDGSDEPEFEDLDSLKKRDLRARAEEREHKLAVMRGEYLHKDDVKETISVLVGETIKLLRDKFENELPPVCAGLDAVRIRAENSRVIDAVCELLHKGEAGEVVIEEDEDDD